MNYRNYTPVASRLIIYSLKFVSIFQNFNFLPCFVWFSYLTLVIPHEFLLNHPYSEGASKVVVVLW